MTFIGVCGDNCTYCPRYIATQKNDVRSLSKVKDLWVRLGFRDSTFPFQDMACSGCKPENACAYSEMRACASRKEIDNCGLCILYPCNKLQSAFESTEKMRSKALSVCSGEEMETLDKSFFRKKRYLDQIHRENRQTILEVKYTFFGERKEFKCTPIRITSNEAVILYLIQQDYRTQDVGLPAGTLSLGYFWKDRFYNAYHWITPSGKTLGFYYNISDNLSITPQKIYWRDLIVDVLITPDFRCRVLDEEELPSGMDESLCQKIMETRDHLLRDYQEISAEIELKTTQWMRRARIIKNVR